MKKHLILALLTGALATAGTPGLAGGKAYRPAAPVYGHAGHHGYSHARPPHGHAGRSHRHCGASRHGYHRHAHHQEALRLAAGAMVLSTLITTLHRPYPAGRVAAGPAYVVQQPYAVRRNRWYQRDAYGDCFEVRLPAGGQQIWTQVAPRHCG